MTANTQSQAIVRVVDDDPDVRRSWQFVIEGEGWNVLTYVNFHQNGTPSPSKLVLRGEYFQHPHPVSPHPSHRISVLFGAAADLFLKL